MWEKIVYVFVHCCIPNLAQHPINYLIGEGMNDKMLKAIIWATITSSLNYSICLLITLSVSGLSLQLTLHSTPKGVFLIPKSHQDTVLQDQVHTLGLSPPVHLSPMSTYPPTNSPTPQSCCTHTRHTLSSSHTCHFHLEQHHGSLSACRTPTACSRQPPHACMPCLN